MVDSSTKQPQTTVTISQSPTMTWTDVAGQIAAGSWAVVLAGVVLFVVTRKWIEGVAKAHIEALSSLKDTTATNRDTLRQMATTDAKIADTLAEISRRQDLDEKAMSELSRNVKKVLITVEDSQDLLFEFLPEEDPRLNYRRRRARLGPSSDS